VTYDILTFMLCCTIFRATRVVSIIAKYVRLQNWRQNSWKRCCKRGTTTTSRNLSIVKICNQSKTVFKIELRSFAIYTLPNVPFVSVTEQGVWKWGYTKNHTY